MTLGFLTQYYPPEIGAPQARLSALARRCVERGHEVVVLTAMPNYPRGRVYPGYGGIWHTEDRDGVRVVRSAIYPTKSARLLRRLRSYFSFVLSSAIVGAAVLPALDYLITESPPLFLGLSGYLLSRLKKARWVFNVSDLWPESAVRLGLVRKGPALRLAQRLESFCYRKAFMVSGQSDEILADIGRRFPGVRLCQFRNGVDTERFSPARRSGAATTELRDGAECVAVYAGLHGIAQGLDQILKAADLLRDVKSLRIVLVGDGPEKEALIRKSRDLRLPNVVFAGPLGSNRIPVFLASCDIALAPLKRYLPGAVPSKIYEAMASGIPVVLCGDGEAAELVRASRAGLVVPPGDGTALASTLRRLAGDAGLRESLGRAARDAALHRFDRRAICDAFIDNLELVGVHAMAA